MEFTVWQSYDSSEVQMLGIHVGENEDIANAFVQSFGMTYPILKEVNGAVYNTYSIIGISPFPLDAIIDQNGVLRYLNSEYDPQFMLRIINGLLDPTGLPDPEETGSNLPEDFQLANYPNPFNPETTIAFTLYDRSDVSVKIYSLTGEQVDIVVSGLRNAGRHEIHWKPKGLSSGVYVYVVEANGLRQSGKMLLMK